MRFDQLPDYKYSKGWNIVRQDKLDLVEKMKSPEYSFDWVLDTFRAFEIGYSAKDGIINYFDKLYDIEGTITK